MNKNFQTLAILALTASVIAVPARAEPQEQNTTDVVFADLDLTTDVGVERFDSRIRVAVNRVCSTSATPDRHEMRWIRNCRAQTMEQITAERDEAIRIARSGENRDRTMARLTVPATTPAE